MNEPILPQIQPITNPRIKDITGQRFGRLVVIGFGGSSIRGRRGYANVIVALLRLSPTAIYHLVILRAADACAGSNYQRDRLRMACQTDRQSIVYGAALSNDAIHLANRHTLTMAGVESRCATVGAIASRFFMPIWGQDLLPNTQ